MELNSGFGGLCGSGYWCFSMRNIWKPPTRSCTMIPALNVFSRETHSPLQVLFLQAPGCRTVCWFLSYCCPWQSPKAIHNLPYQIALFYTNLAAVCKIQDETVQFLRLTIWKALKAAWKRYVLRGVTWQNYNKQMFRRVYTQVQTRVRDMEWCCFQDWQIRSAWKLPPPLIVFLNSNF